LAQDLAIHESPQGLVYVEDLALIPVSNIREVLDVANLGVKMRATYETRLNARSSRSHTIFTVSIVQKSRLSARGGVVGSMINFVDLAGSERLARSQSEGRRFQEAVVINTSLSALGKVVLALASDNARHIPYRDSKLTRILQNSLGGNSYTTLLTTIDPSMSNYEESINSLFFADRCRSVQNRPSQNLIDTEQSNHEKSVHALLQEIAGLKNKLKDMASLRSAAAQTAHSPLGPGKAAVGAGAVASVDGPAKAHGGGGGLTEEAKSRGAQEHGPGLADHTAGVQHQQGSHGTSRPPRGGSKEDKELREIQQQALQRLQLEKEQTIAAEEQVEFATQRLEESRLEQVAQDNERRREVAAIKQNNRDLEVEITRMKCGLGRSGAAAQMASALREIEENTAHVARCKERLVRRLAPELVASTAAAASSGEGGAAASAIERKLEGKVADVGERHAQFLGAVQDGHERECVAMELQHRQWLSGHEAQGRRLAAELEQLHARGRARQERIHGDLISAHDLVSQLGALLDSFLAGVPVNFRSGVRPPVQTRSFSDLMAKLKEEGLLPDKLFEQLSKDMAEVRRQLARHKHSQQGALASQGPPAGRSAADTTDAPGTGGVVDEEWDSHAFARDFCDFPNGGDCLPSGAEVYAPLQRLDVVRLRALCLALRERALMAPAGQEAERAKLREEVAKDLAAHGRVAHIRELEKEITSYKTKLFCEEERLRQLELALQSCRRVASSRPASAGPSPQRYEPL